MWPRHIKFKPCFHINTRRRLWKCFFFFLFADKRKVKWKWLAGLLWQWGDVQMGLGNWSMSVKLEKGSAASAGRHVNMLEAHRQEDRPTQAFLIKNPISTLKGIALALTFHSYWMIWIAVELSDGKHCSNIIYLQEKSVCSLWGAYCCSSCSTGGAGSLSATLALMNTWTLITFIYLYIVSIVIKRRCQGKIWLSVYILRHWKGPKIVCAPL